MLMFFSKNKCQHIVSFQTLLDPGSFKKQRAFSLLVVTSFPGIALRLFDLSCPFHWKFHNLIWPLNILFLTVKLYSSSKKKKYDVPTIQICDCLSQIIVPSFSAYVSGLCLSVFISVSCLSVSLFFFTEVGLQYLLVSDVQQGDSFKYILIYLHTYIFGGVFFRASPMTYGSSQAKGLIRAVAAGPCQSHSSARTEPHLPLTPQLTATLDP